MEKKKKNRHKKHSGFNNNKIKLNFMKFRNISPPSFSP